jgi:hypothetical protein
MPVTVAPFPTEPQLTAIAIGYRNQSYIADAVLPRVSVGRQEFKWWLYPEDETFAAPDSRVGRRSKPNEVDLTATESTSKTEDFGLDDPIPWADIENAPAGRDPRDQAVMQLTDYIMLSREKRCADLVFAAGSYPTGYKATLSSSGQWSHADSTPVTAINNALDTPLMRPNVMVIGRQAWTILATHPHIIKAVQGNSGDRGIASRQQVAELFELEEILVGASRLNTAKKGQAATLARVWGKHCALIHRNRLADTRGGLTFGYTAEWGGRVAGAMEDRNIGLRGGEVVRVGESVKELIVANKAGYLFTDAVA